MSQYQREKKTREKQIKAVNFDGSDYGASVSFIYSLPPCPA
jgi:hypothetical protein